MIVRLTLCADEGKILTNGEVYANQVFLAIGEDGSDYYEITETEYENILKEEAEKTGFIEPIELVYEEEETISEEENV